MSTVMFVTIVPAELTKPTVTVGIVGALTGLGMPEYEAKRYEGRIKEGGILLSVHCDSSDWVDRAKRILETTGAHDIASSSEAEADFSKTEKPMLRTTRP